MTLWAHERRRPFYRPGISPSPAARETNLPEPGPSRPGFFYAVRLLDGGMTLRLATWNINSVRLRIDQVARFVAERAPDVLMLQ